MFRYRLEPFTEHVFFGGMGGVVVLFLIGAGKRGEKVPPPLPPRKAHFILTVMKKKIREKTKNHPISGSDGDRKKGEQVGG